MAPIRMMPVLRRWSGRAASLVLLLPPLVVACGNGEEPTAPMRSELAARTASVDVEQVRLQAMGPGLRWFETHTHATAVDPQAKSGPAQTHFFRGLISQPTDFGIRLGDPFSFAYSINESGQVAGFAGSEFGPSTPDAIRWEADGTPVVLPKATEDGQASAYDMNDGGVVVGVDNEVELGGGFIMHAMRWNPDGSFWSFRWLRARCTSPLRQSPPMGSWSDGRSSPIPRPDPSDGMRRVPTSCPRWVAVRPRWT